MTGGPLSLAPALVTILVALVWRRVATALFCGLAAGAVVLAGFQPLRALGNLGRSLLAVATDRDRLRIVLFILLIGALLELLAASGATGAFGRAAGTRLNTGRRARHSGAAFSLSAITAKS